LVLAGAMFTPLGHGLMLRFTDARSLESVFARVLIWQAAWQRGVSHLPFGVGVAQGLVTHDSLLATDPHNYLLTLFSEMGIPGLLLWLWLFAALWSAGRGLRAHPGSHEVGTALLATLAIAFFNMQFEPTLAGGLYHLLFWWLVGIYYAEGPAEASRAAQPALAR
jgi:O-antigen ligase